MRNRNLIVAGMMFGTAGLFNLTAHAAPPAPVPAMPTPTTKPVETEGTEMQHLRQARKLINEAKDAFDRDPADKAGHRKEILEGIHKALDAIDAEIAEYKTDMKK